MRPIRYGMMVIACGMALTAPCIGAVADAVTAPDLLRQAYLAVVDAEVAEAGARPADATRAYRQALDLYGRLKVQYPGWQTQVIDYRIADCRNQLALLEAPALSGPDTVDLAPAGGTNAEARLKGLVDELAAVRQALLAAPEGRGGDRDWDRLRDERDEALRTAQALQRKVERLEQSSSRGRAAARPPASSNAAPLVVAGVVKAELRRLLTAGESARALQLAREAREMLPAELDLVVLQAMAACQGGAFNEAARVLQPYDTAELRDPSVAVTLGSAYMGLGRLGDARVAMEKALRLDPKSAEAHFNLAQILLAVKPPDAELADAHYARALELGSRPDAALENALRTSVIIARMKSRPRKAATAVTRPTEPMTVPGAAPKPKK